MKTQLLTACFAALTLPAIACNDAPPKPRPTRVASPTPAPPPVRTVSIPERPVPPTPPSKPVDPLAFPHEDGRPVDHLERARALQEEGDLQGTLAELRRAIHHSPDDVELLLELDRVTRKTGDRTLRLVALERIAAARPDDALPLIQQARVLIALKRYDEAIRVATEAMGRDEKNPEIYQALGRVHLNRGELAKAIAQFRKVLSLQPDHGYALNNLGFAYLRANQNEDAVEVLTRASELLPHVAYVFNNLGVALERTGRIEEAKAAYARSSHLSPRYVKAKVNQARVAALSTEPGPEEEEMMEAGQVVDVGE